MSDQTGVPGRLAAIASWIAAASSVLTALYVWRNPHGLIFLNGGLPMLWGAALLLGLLGSVLGLYATVRYRGRRGAALLALALNLSIVLGLIVCTIVVVLTEVSRIEGRGWH